jgi:hypothetical protein
METTCNNADALAQSLAAAAPSAVALDDLAFHELSSVGRIDALVACEKHLRHAHSLMVRALGALEAVRQRERGSRFTEGEVSAALMWAAATAQQRLSDAGALTRLFPETVQLLSDGAVSWEQARSLAQVTTGLDDDAARLVQDRVLPRMPGQSVSSTRQALRRAVVTADPEAAAERHRYLRTRRRVELHPEDDGMATLSIYLPTDTAQALMATLTKIAMKRNKDDERTLDQCRADTLASLVLQSAGVTFSASQAPAIPALVHAVVSVETLLSLGHEPGHLDGYGPICAEQARQIAHAEGSRWRFLLTSSDGTPVDISPRTYTPNAATKRLVRLKHDTCTFPACSMPAERCDLDHGLAFHKGGLTTVQNLGPVCRKHHNLKSQGEWKLNRIGDLVLWTSKTGHTYATEPTRYVQAA